MTKATVTQAFETARVAGKAYELKPTLQGVRLICSLLGGLSSALEKIGAGNPDAVVIIIQAGAGLVFDKQEDVDALAERILFDTPRDDYLPACQRFLLNLLNGGKKDKPTADAAKAADAAKGAGADEAGDAKKA